MGWGDVDLVLFVVLLVGGGWFCGCGGVGLCGGFG